MATVKANYTSELESITLKISPREARQHLRYVERHSGFVTPEGSPITASLAEYFPEFRWMVLR